jgi:hypothetical protein
MTRVQEKGPAASDRVGAAAEVGVSCGVVAHDNAANAQACDTVRETTRLRVMSQAKRGLPFPCKCKSRPSDDWIDGRQQRLKIGRLRRRLEDEGKGYIHRATSGTWEAPPLLFDDLRRFEFFLLRVSKRRKTAMLAASVSVSRRWLGAEMKS